MSRDRLNEHFSAYYEGTLDSGLRQSLEQRFESDLDLREDYFRFVQTMKLLAELPSREAEIPTWLSDRVASRLEAAKAQSEKPGRLAQLFARRFAYVCLAGVAIFGAVMSIRSRSNDTVSTAQFMPNASKPLPVRSESGPKDTLILENTKEGVLVRYNASSLATVTIQWVGSKERVKEYKLNQQSLRAEYLANADSISALEIRISGRDDRSYVFIPSKARNAKLSGSADLLQFAGQLAEAYARPVRLDVTDSSQAVAWEIDTNEPIAAVISKTLGDTTFSVTEQSDGIVVISDR